MSVTFEVSDVLKPDLAARRKTVAALDAIRTRLGSVAEASAANLEGLVATKVHPFVGDLIRVREMNRAMVAG